MIPKWTSKFELKPGKWVFVPTKDSIKAGSKIKKAIEAFWTPPPYYFHLRSGGHVAAIKSHLGHTSFLHIDIQDFFGSINRSRVTRCLRPKLGYNIAREMASASTVCHPNDKNRYVVPYGFVQSQIVAALCLDESGLGTYLEKLSNLKDVSISVYVDDIVISCNDPQLNALILQEIGAASEKSKFKLNASKQQGPAEAITAFNILVTSDSMQIEAGRLQKFAESFATATSEYQRAGILSYVRSVNADQASALTD
jgi:hypothetical protein